MRIAKAIAHAGLCSRRDAERWIEAGRVAVNGKVLTSPAHVVGPGDKIAVDGKALPQAQALRVWRYHKPKGLVTSHKDPQGRKTVFEALPPELPRVVSVGRLDLNTEGLLLLTTDGALARHLELPSTGWLRRYRVRAHGRVTQEALDGLRDGVTIDGVHYGPVEARMDREQGANLWLTLGLREGKNREVKRLAEHLGLVVNRLIRVSFGPFALGDLAVGAVEEVKPKVLVDQLGAKLAGEFGLRRGQLDRDRRAPLRRRTRPTPGVGWGLDPGLGATRLRDRRAFGRGSCHCSLRCQFGDRRMDGLRLGRIGPQIAAARAAHAAPGDVA
jgi:23S rRNA pseudouridine2605 synthase